MVDFASALYLGLAHPASRIGGFAALTTGMPAALGASPQAGRLALQAAALQGSEAGLVAPSTLHLAIDVFDRLARTHVLIADDALYPVMRWGLERVAGLGTPVSWFAHADLAGMLARLRRMRQRHPARAPAVITDATRREGAVVPLARYLAPVAACGGVLVVDHSQVLGLLGRQPSARHPWGHGGGGILRYAGLGAAQPVLLLASWAKAFGAPLASLCGPAALIAEIARDGPTQSHCSAASEAALLAGLDALATNRREGDALRLRLLQRVHHLRAGLHWLARAALPDLQATLPTHPMQQIWLGAPERTLALHAELRAGGFRTALLRRPEGRYVLAVIVRASHGIDEIDALLATMATLVRQLPPCRAVPHAPCLEEQQHV
ncbi:aminotransferase class I/II-fold pyridoxal phosphate-dependent enzyme [Cupriavidus sp. 2TAF22]|uniref:aminotransferase class I/II-fold pyridoxal phosphate-dependent enzyme n=1 Tax=unclassified Cupriavidus TaxID=2640874 RepID=UPI003F908ACD